MKSCGVAIQMKPLSQLLHTVPSRPTPWRVIIIFQGRSVSKGKFFLDYILLEDVERHGGGRRGGGAVTGQTNKTAWGGGEIVHGYFLE